MQKVLKFYISCPILLFLYQYILNVCQFLAAYWVIFYLDKKIIQTFHECHGLNACICSFDKVKGVTGHRSFTVIIITQ